MTESIEGTSSRNIIDVQHEGRREDDCKCIRRRRGTAKKCIPLRFVSVFSVMALLFLPYHATSIQIHTGQQLSRSVGIHRTTTIQHYLPNTRKSSRWHALGGRFAFTTYQAPSSFTDAGAAEKSPFSLVASSAVEGQGIQSPRDANNENTTLFSSYFSSTAPPAHHGLSKFHLSILSRSTERQRFVTGRYPIVVSVTQNPTRKWLNLGRRLRNDGSELAETEILVNGTALDRSLASIDRFQWIDDDERILLRNSFEMVSIELLAEINLERPGYLHILPANGAGSSADLISKSNQLSGKDSKKLPYWNRGNIPSIVLNERESTSQIFRDRLWVTGFSLAGRRGLVSSIGADTCRIDSINERSGKHLLWPNEVQGVPTDFVARRRTCQSLPFRKEESDVTKLMMVDANHNTLKPEKSDMTDAEPLTNERSYQDALLVCDGFLVPTKDRGGLYVVKNPGNPLSEWTLRLTDERERWFYHRAVWIDLTGDGRKSILTARCKVSTVLGRRRSGDGMVTSGIRKYGQLVWLECPTPDSYDPNTGTPLEKDGTVFDALAPRHLPWKARVLATGPDVMFAVADLDPTDDTIEVISSQFFEKKVSLHSIRKGIKPQVTFSRFIDENCGQAFGSILADLDRGSNESVDCFVPGQRVIDSGSTVKTLKAGDSFSHVLVTSHECSFKAEPSNVNGSENRGKHNADDAQRSFPESSSSDGGSLFAYRVPRGKDSWKTHSWQRSTIASGFKVNGQLNNMINPGAPGFVYTFYSKKKADARRPLIAVAGDCAESAYVFRPSNMEDEGIHQSANSFDASTKYKLMFEIECGATVGSIGIGYDDFSSADQESGFAKLYVPCYEKDKVLVFGLGSGDDDY